MVSYFDTNQKTFGPVSYFGYRPFFSWKGVFTVNDHNKEQQLRYLEEVCIPLHRAGFETQPLDESQLPVHWNGAPLCRITGKGSVTCPIRRIHRELLRYHLCGYFFAAPRNSCIYVPQRPFRQHWKLLARHQDHSQRPQSLPQHGQAGTNRFGAAWLPCQAAPVSSQRE